jgi:hypothetical protein
MGGDRFHGDDYHMSNKEMAVFVLLVLGVLVVYLWLDGGICL